MVVTFGMCEIMRRRRCPPKPKSIKENATAFLLRKGAASGFAPFAAVIPSRFFTPWT
jgi:hypothetical protein